MNDALDLLANFALPIALCYAAVGVFLRASMKDRDPEMHLSAVGTASVIFFWPICVARGVLQK